MHKTRLEVFSDGVIALLTTMVLNLLPPHGDVKGPCVYVESGID